MRGAVGFSLRGALGPIGWGVEVSRGAVIWDQRWETVGLRNRGRLGSEMGDTWDRKWGTLGAVHDAHIVISNGECFR